MEAWTSGLVSGSARKAWRQTRPQSGVDFLPERAKGRRGWRMIGWESQIAMCRALGRGAAPQVHPFDQLKTRLEQRGF